MNTTRLLPALAAAAALALAPGLALADPGNGQGSGITNNPNVPPAQSAPDTPVPQPDSTLDGTPSANGNGGGEATGQPCAGCVGNADDQEPPGQVPGGGDANSGHECDANAGIGRGNPAHTGCTTPPTENPPTENPPTQNPPADNPLTEPPAPEQPFGGGATPAPVPQAAEVDDLAVTGFDVLPLGLTGLALVGAGGAAVVMARRFRRP